MDIVEIVAKLLINLGHWRSLLCFIVGNVLAAGAHQHISADPLRWIVAGAIVLASLVIGSKWEDYRTEID